MSKDLQIFCDDKFCIKNDNEPIKGIRSLCQKFLMELLTISGSMQYLPERGCNFLIRLRRATNEFDINAAFAAAKNTIIRNLRGDYTAATPPTERFAAAQLSQIILDGYTVQLELKLQNRAGRWIQVTVPPISL